MIPKEQVDQVAAATDIVALVGGYVQLKNAGKNLTGLCPFHNERSPSFVVTIVLVAGCMVTLFDS